MQQRKVRSSVMVLSVWIEGDDPAEIVVRFKAAYRHLGRESRESWLTRGVEDACEAVHDWLEAFVVRKQSDHDDP